MKLLRVFIIAVASLSGAALFAQDVSVGIQPKLPVGGRGQITGWQLEQMLAAKNREPDKRLAEQLYELELTERLSAAKLTRCEASLPGPEARRALRVLAHQSLFLDPPATEIPVIAEPDLQAQRRMVALSVDYASKTIRQLPNLYATKVTNSFQHKAKKPLHWVSTEAAIVRYQDGEEILGSGESQLGTRERLGGVWTHSDCSAAGCRSE